MAIAVITVPLVVFLLLTVLVCMTIKIQLHLLVQINVSGIHGIIMAHLHVLAVDGAFVAMKLRLAFLVAVLIVLVVLLQDVEQFQMILIVHLIVVREM